MGKVDQFQRYQEEMPFFFDQIAVLEKKHSTPLIRKMLERRYDWDSFRGIMAEMDFGLFLDTFCEHLQFEPSIEGLTPDWLVQIQGKQVLVEVARLKDTKEVDEQTKADQDAGRISFHTLKMRPERVFGNTIMTKVNAYGDLVKSQKMPFVIGIYNRHLSGAHSEDAGILFHKTHIEDRLAKEVEVPDVVKNLFLEKLNLARTLVSGILWLDQPALNIVTWKPNENEFEFWDNAQALYPLPKTPHLDAIAGKIRY